MKYNYNKFNDKNRYYNNNFYNNSYNYRDFNSDYVKDKDYNLVYNIKNVNNDDKKRSLVFQYKYNGIYRTMIMNDNSDENYQQIIALLNKFKRPVTVSNVMLVLLCITRQPVTTCFRDRIGLQRLHSTYYKLFDINDDVIRRLSIQFICKPDDIEDLSYQISRFNLKNSMMSLKLLLQQCRFEKQQILNMLDESQSMLEEFYKIIFGDDEDLKNDFNRGDNVCDNNGKDSNSHDNNNNDKGDDNKNGDDNNNNDDNDTNNRDDDINNNDNNDNNKDLSKI